MLFRFVQHVGTFTRFVRSYMSLRAEKLLFGSPLESSKSLFKSPARKILSYLFNTWFKLFEFLGEIRRCFVLVVYKQIQYSPFIFEIVSSMHIVSDTSVCKSLILLAMRPFSTKTNLPPPFEFLSLRNRRNY